MILSTGNITHYLLGRGLLTHESVVDGDLVVVEATSRNRNFKIIRRDHPGYFVKQVKSFEPQNVETLQSETSCYRLSQSDPDFRPLAALMPKFYDFDPVRHALIIELLADGDSLSDYHRRLGAFPVELGKQMGEILGTYQREMGEKLRSGAKSDAFAKRVPWILSLHQTGTHLFSQLSAANTQVLSIIQKYPDFQQMLDALRAGWRFDSLIHGDIKWDNLIVMGASYGEAGEAGEAGEGGELKLRLVDWELADFGDACWDAGAVFQSYLSFWVFSMPAVHGTPAEHLVRTAQYPIEKMLPAIRAFWNTYVETRGLNDKEAQEALERSISYGAARMIQTAYEYMFYSPQITPSALYLLQLSLNILKSPREAITSLLAL